MLSQISLIAIENLGWIQEILKGQPDFKMTCIVANIKSQNYIMKIVKMTNKSKILIISEDQNLRFKKSQM